MDPSLMGSPVLEAFECSYCHEAVSTEAEDKHLYTTLETVPAQTPRTHLHCSELLLQLPEYAAWKTSSKTRLPTKCFGCERERGDPGHEVDQSDEGIVYAVTSVLPYPSVVVYCPKSKEGVQPGPGTVMLDPKGAIEALETRAKASRIEWEHNKIVFERPALSGRNTLKKKNRDTVAGPSTAAVTSTAGPSLESQATLSGQKRATDGKGKDPDSEIATATEETEGQGIRKSVTYTVQATDTRLSQFLAKGFPDNLGQRFIDDVGHTSGYAPGPSIGQIHSPGPNLPAEVMPFQQGDEQSDQTHSRCARCCCSKCFCM